MCGEVMSIYYNNNNNNNNDLVDTFCGKNLSRVLLNIVVRIVTSWLQIFTVSGLTTVCVCVCVCVHVCVWCVCVCVVWCVCVENNNV